MITQLWLLWHGLHSKIQFSRETILPGAKRNYLCIVCGAERNSFDKNKRSY